MRRSFGPKMGGGGGGGGGMMKTLHRAVIGGGSQDSSSYSHAAARTAGNQQPITNTTLSLSSSNSTNPSSPCAYLNHPVSVPDAPPQKWGFTTSPTTGEEFDWEYVDGGGGGGDGVHGFCDDVVVFGGVPSEEEVHHAVSSFREVVESCSFRQMRETYGSDDDGVETPTRFKEPGLELDWTEPSMQLCYSTSADKVLDAFHLLQTEPSVQRMVISLSSDKAVWDAVMNNEVVRELRESVIEDKSIFDGSEGGVHDSNPVTQVLRWIFVNTKDRVVEIVEKITKVVNELVRPMNKDEKAKTDGNVGLDSFEEKLRSSFFLSVVVLLIVVVSRSGKC
ncbi:hypothetical protein SSX86_020372 [Deinandra increscens subsp. villosa]|uniref:Uncharacterized protein n=1 Tax=Deinandra increscens subsp. villosa TaxID=3103831 RepID=A0AAP0GQS5_9ASTR